MANPNQKQARPPCVHQRRKVMRAVSSKDLLYECNTWKEVGSLVAESQDKKSLEWQEDHLWQKVIRVAGRSFMAGGHYSGKKIIGGRRSLEWQEDHLWQEVNTEAGRSFVTEGSHVAIRITRCNKDHTLQ
eukprot:1152189-Pelagomonas_calceolata.AAC.1